MERYTTKYIQVNSKKVSFKHKVVFRPIEEVVIPLKDIESFSYYNGKLKGFNIKLKNGNDISIIIAHFGGFDKSFKSLEKFIPYVEHDQVYNYKLTKPLKYLGIVSIVFFLTIILVITNGVNDINKLESFFSIFLVTLLLLGFHTSSVFLTPLRVQLLNELSSLTPSQIHAIKNTSFITILSTFFLISLWPVFSSLRFIIH